MFDAYDERERLAEHAIVLRARAGDRSAFHVLVEQYQRRLTYYVNRLTGSTEQARDLLQEVWIEVYRQLPGLQSPAAFRVWLYRIAHRRAVKYLRRKGIEARARQTIAASHEEFAEDDRELLEDVELVHYSLARLSLEHREVLTLRFIEDLSVREIADIVGCGEGTAKSRLHYAKAAMRTIIAKEQGA